MFDIVILNGFVLDGSGRDAQRLDLGIRDGKIAALGDLQAAEANKVIDAGAIFADLVQPRKRGIEPDAFIQQQAVRFPVFSDVLLQ